MMRILPEPVVFEWDESNANKNWLKHRVQNRECEDVFLRNRFLMLKDEVRSKLEQRYIVIGSNQQDIALTLIITLRRERVRIISARRASRKERNFYEKTFKNS